MSYECTLSLSRPTRPFFLPRTHSSLNRQRQLARCSGRSYPSHRHRLPFAVPAEPPRGELITIQDDLPAGTHAMASHLRQFLPTGIAWKVFEAERLLSRSFCGRGTKRSLEQNSRNNARYCTAPCTPSPWPSSDRVTERPAPATSWTRSTGERAASIQTRKRHWRSEANLPLHAELEIRHVLGSNAIYQLYCQPSSC